MAVMAAPSACPDGAGRSASTWLLRADSFLDLLKDRRVVAFLTLANLSLFFVPVAVLSLIFLVGASQAWWLMIPVCVMAVMAVLGRVYLRPLCWQKQTVALGLFAAAIVAAFAMNAVLYDTTFDGMSYHTEAILHLLRGSNPDYGVFDGRYSLWTNNYPKATWYFSAGMARLMGNFEMGKSYHLILIFACFSYMWGALSLTKLSLRARLLTAVAVAANPIAMSQLFTFYVDGALASLLTLSLGSGIVQLVAPRRLDRIVFVLSSALCIAVKFTGVAYVVLILALLGCAQIAGIIRWRGKEGFAGLGAFALEGLVILLLGAVFLGFSPYVTHVRDGHNPMYPVEGANKIDVIVGETPQAFLKPGWNRINRFGVAIFGVTDNRRVGAAPKIKIPFTVRMSELRTLSTPDNRIGGWGVFFGGVIIASLLLYIAVKGWRGTPVAALGVFIVLATSLSNPYAWWARLTPQVALLPVFLLLPALMQQRVWTKRIGQSLIVILLVNALTNALCSLRNSLVLTRDMRTQMAQVYRQCGAGPYLLSSATSLHFDQLPPYHGMYIEELPQAQMPNGQVRRITFALRSNGAYTLVKQNCVETR